MTKTAIHYQINSKNANAHLFAITLTIAKADKTGQILWLPAWTIGSYLIRDFSKHIVSIKAYSSKNKKPLTISQLDKNHWSIAPCPEPVVIDYQVYAFDLSVRGAYLDNKRAFFNGNALLLAVDKQLDKPHSLTIKPNNTEHTVYTTLKAIGKHQYQADNYHHLIDSPVEIAAANLVDFSVNNIKHDMVISGEHKIDKQRLICDLKQICAHHQRFFGDAPFEHYLFLVCATHNRYGGLEHCNSTALICPRNDLPNTNLGKVSGGYMRFLSLCSHEYFHAWWVKQIKPEVFVNSNLTQEVYTEQLWIFEGFTSYYDELTLLRTQLINLKAYLTLFAKTISRVYRTPGRLKQSLAAASFEAWTKFYQPNENSNNATISYYAKGALLAFVLDVEIRQKTNEQYSLDSVLQNIWQQGHPNGINNNTVQQSLHTLTNINFDDFFNRYLYNVEELPLKEAFAYLGIDCKLTAETGQSVSLGITITEADGFALITSVSSASPAERAGLYVNDVIIAVDKVRSDFKTFNDQLERYGVNEHVSLSVFKDHTLHHINVTLAKAPKRNCELSLNARSSKLTKKRLNSWRIGNTNHPQSI